MRTLFPCMIKECTNCKSKKEHHAKGLCYTCYKKLKWQPKIQTCKRCKRKMAIHAKGLCAGCYNYIFHLDKNKAYSQRKQNNVDLKTYRKTTKECVICGLKFDPASLSITELSDYKVSYMCTKCQEDLENVRTSKVQRL